jgi:hypothetical protein
MKTKLLKKSRKRFEIIHMPKGFTSCGNRYEYNLYKLTDSTNEWYERYAQLGRKDDNIQFQKDEFIFETESECIYYLKQCILNRLRGEGHLGRKDVWMKKKHKKVWHL